MTDLADLINKLREALSPPQRDQLAAALAVSDSNLERVAIVPRQTPPPIPAVSLAPGPGMTGSLDDPPPIPEPEKPDNPDDRAQLLAILAANPSGISPYELLDRYKVPPLVLDAARREGQTGPADRGIGLTSDWGGGWSPDKGTILNDEVIQKHKKRFKQRMRLDLDFEVTDEMLFAGADALKLERTAASFNTVREAYIFMRRLEP